jgi:uncharacterized membrane protein (TIGR02234 family)
VRRVLPLVAGILALVSINLTWARVSGGGFDVDVSGVEVTAGLGQALALTLLAGWLVLLVLRRWGRAIMSALIGLIGVAMVALAILGHDIDDATARARLRTVSLADPVVTIVWWAPALFGLAGAIAVAGAALGTRGVSGSRRFERTPGPEATAWDQLDAGEDPTTGAFGGGVTPDDGTEWDQAEGEDDR